MGIREGKMDERLKGPDRVRLLDAARLAQSVERLTLNQVVEGSSPSVGVLFLSF